MIRPCERSALGAPKNGIGRAHAAALARRKASHVPMSQAAPRVCVRVRDMRDVRSVGARMSRSRAPTPDPIPLGHGTLGQVGGSR